MIYGALIVALQIFCGIDCVRRGKTCNWLWLILVFPLIGSIIYIVAEMLPARQGGGYARRYNPMQPVRQRQPSAKDLRRLQDEVQFSNTVKNRENLADAYVAHKQYAEAMALYRECLSGQLENDAALLFKLSEAAYGQADYEAAIEALNRIRASSPDYRPARVRLLLARSHEAAGQLDQAESTYDQALRAHGDLEIKCRFAQFLQQQGQSDRAAILLDEIRIAGERMPPHARKLNRAWIDQARKQGKAVGSRQ